MTLHFGKAPKKSLIPSSCIQKWVEKNFPEAKTRKNGREYVVCNPLKPSQDKPRLNINVETGGCWDWTGNEWAGPLNHNGKRQTHIIRLVQLMRGCSYTDAVREITEDKDFVYTPYKEELELEDPEYQQVTIPDGFTRLTGPNDFFSARSWNYLISRGYTPDTILSENIHYKGQEVLWLYTEFGDIVYYQTRNVTSKHFSFPPNEIKDQTGKVIAKLEVTREDVLYGFDFVPRSNYVIIVESIFNRISIGQCCVASAGAAMTNGQMKRLKFLDPKYGVILAPDNDKAGIESIINNGTALLQNGFSVFWTIPPKLEYKQGHYIKDWNELYTHMRFNNDKIIETFNMNLSPLNESTIMKLKSILVLGLNNAKSAKKSFIPKI